MIDSIKYCFTFQYPVAVLKTDGTIIDALDDQELLGLTEVADFVYPLYLIDKNGNEKKINNINQLEGQLKNCDKKNDE